MYKVEAESLDEALLQVFHQYAKQGSTLTKVEAIILVGGYECKTVIKKLNVIKKLKGKRANLGKRP